ncbi:MAG: hypothetical protein DMG57_29935 [Acidobacteria bacterium]|nr:MAG: hypothetical protein DMG57_29935 [Acidobacteriota bacterium]
MLAACATAVWADVDPPSRVARLNLVSGAVSFEAAGLDEWAAATVNYPMTTGDHLWADDQAHAEMHVGSTIIRLDSRTAFSFLRLDDQIVQMRLSEGSLNITIHYLSEDDAYEVDTPNGAITLLRPGTYRINSDPDRQQTVITVRGGEAEVTAGGSAFPVHARQAAYITGTEFPTTEVHPAEPRDYFDEWALNRDEREQRRPAPRYVSRETNGWEDLDDYGSWSDNPGYGYVWMPRVDAGWAPYRYGRWAWVEPWGWTWIDDSPWGFAPFHYGRWCYVSGGWAWVPGRMAVRPVYAPALVVFVGGPRWAGSFGGGGGVGWVPLAPGEVFVPAYHVSPTYVNRVNVVNVTNVTNITNVTNVRYANQNVPGAVTAISRSDFANSRAVSRSGVNVSSQTVASAQVIGMTAPVAPRRESVMGHSADNMTSIPRPRESVLAHPVVTRSVPPPAPVPFAARQQALAENPGRPLDNATLTNLRRQMPVARPEAPVARPAAPIARPIEPAGRVQPYETPATGPAPAGRPQPYEPPNARPQPVQRANPDRPPVVERAAPEARPQPVQRANPDRPPNAQRIEPEQRRTERVEPRTERQEIRRDERRPAPQERPRDEKAKPEKAKPERPKSSDR